MSEERQCYCGRPGAPSGPEGHPYGQGPRCRRAVMAKTTAIDTADIPEELISKGSTALGMHLRKLPVRKIPTLGEQSAAVLAAVLPAYKATMRAEIIMAERAAIIAGIKEYFAASDDPLYDDVRTLCGRIERGEYGTRGDQ